MYQSDFGLTESSTNSKKKIQNKAQIKQHNQREMKILNLVKKELDENRQMLEFLIEDQVTDPSTMIITGMKDVFWNSLSDGGELQWVDDLEILDKVSNAYYYIRALIKMENEYFDPSFKMRVTNSQVSTYAGSRIVEYVTGTRPHVLSTVKEALSAIEDRYSNLSSNQ